jgi:hypothetical protein
MELPIFNTFINFSRHHLCCFTIASLFVLDKFTAWNRCLQHRCFTNLCKIALVYKNSDSKAQHFLFRFANIFMISLHALCTPTLPIPLYLSWIGVSTLPHLGHISCLPGASNFRNDVEDAGATVWSILACYTLIDSWSHEPARNQD